MRWKCVQYTFLHGTLSLGGAFCIYLLTVSKALGLHSVCVYMYILRARTHSPTHTLEFVHRARVNMQVHIYCIYYRLGSISPDSKTLIVIVLC